MSVIKLRKNIFRKNIKFILPVALFLVSLIIRINNIKNSAIFVGDQEYQDTYAMTLVKDFHPIWIGVSAAHTGFYLGPLWTYFTAFWLQLSNGDPLITNYVSVFLGSTVSILIYLIVVDIFKKRSLALISSLIYIFSPLFVYYDRVYWNPTPLPLLSLILFYSLYKAINGKNIWWIVFFSTYALVFHTHLSLLPLGFVGIYLFLTNIKTIRFKYIFLSFIAFLIFYSPLIVFDINHNWSNLKSPFKFANGLYKDNYHVDPVSHIKAFIETAGRVWFLKIGNNESDEVLFDCGLSGEAGKNPLSLVYSERTNKRYLYSIPILIAICYFLVNKKTWVDKSWKLLAVFFLAIIFSFLLFPGGAFEYYLLGVFPFLSIIFAYFTQQKSPFIKIIIILFIFFVSFRGVWVVLNARSDFGLGVKRGLIKDVSISLSDKSFELYQSGNCHKYEGWRYLFALYKTTPYRSSSDIDFGWLYPDDVKMDAVDFKVIMHEKNVPWISREDLYQRIDKGGFSALIYKL